MTELLTDAELETARHNVWAGSPFGVLCGDGKILTCPSPIWTLLSRLLATIASDRARIVELEAELVTAESEAAHYSDLAMVDPGANPRVAWKDKAARLTAENERLMRALNMAIKCEIANKHSYCVGILENIRREAANTEGR